MDGQIQVVGVRKGEREGRSSVGKSEVKRLRSGLDMSRAMCAKCSAKFHDSSVGSKGEANDNTYTPGSF
jgi:hypothetical protein